MFSRTARIWLCLALMVAAEPCNLGLRCGPALASAARTENKAAPRIDKASPAYKPLTKEAINQGKSTYIVNVSYQTARRASRMLLAAWVAAPRRVDDGRSAARMQGDPTLQARPGPHASASPKT